MRRREGCLTHSSPQWVLAEMSCSKNQNWPLFFLFILPIRHVVTGWLRTAVPTFVNPTTSHISASRIKKRFLTFRVAIWAKPMRWFGAAFIRLQHISDGPLPDTLKFVILLFSIPCF